MGAFDFLKKLTSGWDNQKAIEFYQDQRNQIHNFSTIIGFGNQSANRDFNEFITHGYSEGTDVKPVIDKIANTAGSVEWCVYQKLRDGSVEKIDDSGLNTLLEMPNSEMTWGDLQQASIIQLLTTGNVFQLGTDAVGFGEGAYRELEVLASQLIEPIISLSGELLGWEYTIGKKKYKYSLEELVHTKYYNPTTKGYTDFLGLSPLEAAMNAYQTSNNQWEAASSLLKNKGAIGFISNDSDDILTEEEQDQAQAAFDRKVKGADKFGKVTVTPSKMRYQAMGMSASDMKIIEMGIMNLRAICNVYGVDSSLFNDPSNKTFNNRKEAEKALWTNVNIPILNKFKFQYNKTFVKAYSEAEGRDLFVDFDLSDVQAMHEDKDKQADRGVKLAKAMTDISKMVANGEISRESAVQILSTSFDVTVEDANTLISEKQQNEE